MTMKPSCNAKATMATLTIGDLPDEIYTLLKSLCSKPISVELQNF